jgi:uncharacterized protein (UPF0332 family)
VSAENRQIPELCKRAADSLAAAENLLADGYPDFAASRAYYAAFYAASALLLCSGKAFSKHSAVIAHVQKDYVKTGRLPGHVGKIIAELFQLRDIADYGGAAHVQPSQAQKAISDARTFVDAISHLLPQN